MKVLRQLVLVMVWTLYQNCVAQPIESAQYVDTLKCPDNLSMEDIVRRAVDYGNGQRIDCDAIEYKMNSVAGEPMSGLKRQKRQEKIAEIEVDNKKIVILISNNIINTATAHAANNNNNLVVPTAIVETTNANEKVGRAPANTNSNGGDGHVHRNPPITFPAKPTYHFNYETTRSTPPAPAQPYQFLTGSGYGTSLYGNTFGRPSAGHRFGE